MIDFYTIGHSNLTIHDFIYKLKLFEINALVDVRSTPFSKIYSQFNAQSLKQNLRNSKIFYIPMYRELGGQRIEHNVYSVHQGKLQVDFNKTMQSKLFLQGIKRLEIGLKRGYKIALMCAEQDPLKCHRFALISHYLNLQGFEIAHITRDILCSHELIEQNLLEMFSNKIDKFNPTKPLNQAYYLLNQKIGFKKEFKNNLITNNYSYYGRLGS